MDLRFVSKVHYSSRRRFFHVDFTAVQACSTRHLWQFASKLELGSMDQMSWVDPLVVCSIGLNCLNCFKRVMLSAGTIDRSRFEANWVCSKGPL